MNEEVEKCIRCSAELQSEIALQTGICAECWTEDDEDESLDFNDAE